MSIKNKAKDKFKKQIKKITFKILKPFLPFILIIGLLFFVICTIIDAIFIQEVQTDASDLPPEQAEIRKLCIEKSEYLNTCNNFIGSESTNYLLDVDNKENDKLIEWSHLYAIMAFHNMTNNRDINESLLNEVATHFESTFKYEKDTAIIETTSTDENGNQITTTREEEHYILIESDSIIGHYKYNYEQKTVEKENIKTTGKIFTNEELIGEKYERLKRYLKEELRISEDDIDTDIQVIIQAASGYYEGEENISWLQENPSSSDIITDGSGLVPTGMFTWPVPRYTKITSHFGMRIHPITGVYKLHSRYRCWSAYSVLILLLWLMEQ